MNTKTATFFWVTAISILLVSIIVSLHSSSHSGSSITTNIHRIVGVKLDIFSAIYRRHHHHRHRHRHHPGRDKISCNESLIRSSNLTSLYKISVVITVDKKGCANFSSIQKAIDAAPDFSRSWTLIMVDSGTYRY